MKTLLVLLAVVVAAISAERVSYRGYKAYLVEPVDIAQWEVLKEWENVVGIDYWDGLKRPGYGGSRVMVQPDLQAEYETFLQFHAIKYRLMVPDVEDTLIREREENARQWRSREGLRTADGDFNRYWSLEDIFDYYEMLAAQFPNLVRLWDQGTTHEGRPIKVMVISRNENANNPVVFVEGGLHAREWAAHMSIVYLIFNLVERSALNADLLDNIDWVIVPMMNPDGYAHTQEARFWRKNRRPVTALCTGVDNNRNFGFEWRAGGNACLETFPGSEPLSEPENIVVSQMLAQYRGRITFYIATHTFGNMILWPEGWTMGLFAPNWQEHQAVGEEANAAIRAFSGSNLIVGNVADVLGPAFGAGDDYGYSVGEARLAYTLELRGGGTGLAGFDLPADQLFEVVQECMLIFRTMGRYAADL